MNSANAPIAILGGGCAGLSLAVRLADSGSAGRPVVVLEEREQYRRDRTWCSWSVRPHRFDACVSHRWNAWSVRHRGRTTLQRSDQIQYEHLPADAFYREACAALERHGQTELCLDTRVRGLEAGPHGVRIETSKGLLEAFVVIDTRPCAPPPGTLLQHFIGWHVRLEDPVLDPTQVTLMDFDVSQQWGPQFLYVLPFGPDEALVEATFLGAEPLAAEIYEQSIKDYIQGRLGTAVRERLWSERGAIPMTTVPARPTGSPRILRAGGAAGAIKPSSGYAFSNIQRESDYLCAELQKGGLPRPRPPRSSLMAAMDRTFLRFLKRHPERAPATFERLFRSVQPEPLARFLMETGRPTDLLNVVAAMPKLPFLRAALSGGRP